MNVALKHALADAGLKTVDVAGRLGVDPKTVERWIAGRRPHPGFRTALAALVGVAETDLWPPMTAPTRVVRQRGANEVKAAYPHRWAVPADAWRSLFASAEREIGVLVYGGLFLAEDPRILRLWREKARSGVKVRILLGDPDCPQVAQRGAEEGIDEAIAAKIRNVLVLYRPILLGVPGIEVRLHRTVLYASIYRADDEMLVNPHIFGYPALAAPVLHLRATVYPQMLATYADSFERVWVNAVHVGRGAA